MSLAVDDKTARGMWDAPGLVGNGTGGTRSWSGIQWNGGRLWDETVSDASAWKPLRFCRRDMSTLKAESRATKRATRRGGQEKELER